MFLLPAEATGLSLSPSGLGELPLENVAQPGRASHYWKENVP